MANKNGNRSHAVVAQRFEEKDSLDDFPTPPWATRALVEYIIKPKRAKDKICWEPAANRGYMVRPLEEYFKYVMASDIHDYGDRNVADFLSIEVDKNNISVDWIITNPPFNKAEQFIKKARSIAKDGVAMLVRTSFLEGVKRYNQIFCGGNPDIVAQFSERVPMVKGRYDHTASTATSYCWLVWFTESDEILFKDTYLRWIPPCKKMLEKPSDWA